jgi:YHS domain-containing protein
MIRFLFLRIVVALLVLWVARYFFRSLFGGLNSQVSTNPPRPAPPPVSKGGELKKDPVCGTYVSADTSVTMRINGQTVHFCSLACRDKYRTAS